MQQKVLASLTAIVGGLGAIFGLLIATGVDMSDELQGAITAVAGLALVVVGIWLNPSVGIGDPSVNGPQPGGGR